MPKLKVQNLYNTTITELAGIPASGDCSFTVATPPINSNGFIIISPENPTLREIMYYHDVVGNRIYVRAENRFSPKEHSELEVVKMNDVAEIFNTFSDMISQAFYVEKTGGLTVRVWGGYVYYNGSPVSVPDTNLTMADNTTNYIKYEYTTNTFIVDSSNVGNIKSQVVTLSGSIVSIGYRTAKESFIDFSVALTGALPDQSGKAGYIFSTDGSNPLWIPPVPVATNTALGKIELATQSEVNAGTAGALAVTPDTLKNRLDNDIRLNTNLIATQVGVGTSYSSVFQFTRFGCLSLSVTSSSGFTVSGFVELSTDGISGWTSSGYGNSVNNGGASSASSGQICVPIRGGVYVRIGCTGTSPGTGTATGVLFY